jgi:hypothetical protein
LTEDSRVPESKDTPTLPPGATAETILQAFLPLVVQAASDSAAAATSAGTAVQAVEARLASLETAVKENTTAVKQLVTLGKKEDKSRQNQQAWVRTLFPPSTIVLILTIAAAAFGIRVSMPGATLQAETPSTHQTP